MLFGFAGLYFGAKLFNVSVMEFFMGNKKKTTLEHAKDTNDVVDGSKAAKDAINEFLD
ncbi:MAG: hypothetical protein HRU25_13130 [Psychrobium sp.]|nr:hypothetical protein [Psychrobium sp.]